MTIIGSLQIVMVKKNGKFRSFQGWPFQAECTQTHSNGMVSLTFTVKKQKV